LLQVLAQSNQRVPEISSPKENPQISPVITSMSLELVQFAQERIDVGTERVGLAGKASESAMEVAQSPQRVPKTSSPTAKAQTSPVIALPLPMLA
jgi:hypothetical protein